MNQKRLFFVLLAILITSIALLLYAKAHIGPDFVNSL